MKSFTKGLAQAAVPAMALPALVLPLSPPSNAAPPYNNCEEAHADGAFNLTPGDPGYSWKLDPEGKGVACQSNGVVAAPPPDAPTVGRKTYITTVTWEGTDCVLIKLPPDPSKQYRNNRPRETCSLLKKSTELTNTASSGETIGADPLVGKNSRVTCKVSDMSSGRVIIEQSNDEGNDPNCITEAP